MGEWLCRVMPETMYELDLRHLEVQSLQSLGREHMTSCTCGHGGMQNGYELLPT